MDPVPLSILTIDVDAVVANWRLLRAKAGSAECTAVMKADGYGLGTAILAPALAEAGCRGFFVAHPAEGAALRQQLDGAGHRHARIFILHGGQAAEAAYFNVHRLLPVLSTAGQIAAWRERAGSGTTAIQVALQVESGMNRLGLLPDAFHALLSDPDGLSGLEVVLVMSHLACADQPEHPMNRQQLERFQALRSRLPDVPASLSNSAGIFHGADFRFDLVRPGIALYGVDPLERPLAANPFKPVVDLKARILQICEIGPAEAVGYGASFLAKRPTRLATVSVGYADGYMRALSGKAHAAIGGVRVPMTGRVSMDLLTFDITELAPGSVQEGQYLDLIGPSVTVGELARQGGTIGYEILTRLGSRLARRYRKGADVFDIQHSSVTPTAKADSSR